MPIALTDANAWRNDKTLPAAGQKRLDALEDSPQQPVRMMKNPRNTPRQPNTHLLEREQKIRRIRRHRLLGETSKTLPPVLTRVPGDLLGALRDYCQTLEQDGDSCEAWLGLSTLFDALEDSARSGLCRGVARHLQAHRTTRDLLTIH